MAQVQVCVLAAMLGLSGPSAAQDAGRLAAEAAAPSAPVVEMEIYRLGPGDEVAVTYPYNAELNYEGVVGPDGRLTLPLIGPIPVAGATVREAQALISSELRREKIVADARPSIAIRTYAASVYVGGEVRNPGAVNLNRPMDAMRAIIMAGGALDTARSRRVVVIRQMPDGEASLRYVNLREYVKAGGVGQDEALRPYDVIFVPRSSVAEANLWIEQHINRMLPFNRSLNFNVGRNGTRAFTAN